MTISSELPASWLDLPADTPFGLANLPYGVFTIDGGPSRVGVAIGDQVLDAGAAAAAVGAPFGALLAGPLLDPLLAAGRPGSRCGPGSPTG
jgi:fumarylacetoacetase